jgi:hypothetical protein
MVQANNGSDNYFIGRPNGYQTMQDAVFVVSLFTSPASIQVSSGGNTQTFNAPAGAQAYQVPMGVGSQSFSVTRNGQTVFSGTSLKQIINGCICGLYNFNAYGMASSRLRLTRPCLFGEIILIYSLNSWQSTSRFQ